MTACTTPIEDAPAVTELQKLGDFTLIVPEGWKATFDEGVVLFEPEGLQRRYGLYSLTLEEKAPELSPVIQRNGIDSHIETAEGGFGGPEHFLTLWRAEGSQWLVLKAHQQTSDRPDFAEAWTVFDSVSVKKA